MHSLVSLPFVAFLHVCFFAHAKSDLTTQLTSLSQHIQPLSACHSSVKKTIFPSFDPLETPLEGWEESESLCASECVKMTMALELANCMLAGQSLSRITCKVNQKTCRLPNGCLSKSESQKNGLGWNLFSQDEQEVHAHDQVTAQSSTFTAAYQYVDNLCLYVAQVKRLNVIIRRMPDFLLPPAKSARVHTARPASHSRCCRRILEANGCSRDNANCATRATKGEPC